jgi:hypothetical protein
VEVERDAKDRVPETQASLDQILLMQPQEKMGKVGKSADKTKTKDAEVEV